MLENLTAFTVALRDRVVDYLLAFAAVGALTMAIIQTIKEMTPLRAWFHRRELERWLARGLYSGCQRIAQNGPASDEGKSAAPLKARADRLALTNVFASEPRTATSELEACRHQLIGLATAGDAAALYALESEKLAGQLNAASLVVADFPRKYPELLRCFARGADLQDVEGLLEGDPPAEPSAKAQKGRREAWARHLERKVRVTHQIQRSIDAFQIATAYRWGWMLQVASFCLSFAIAAAAVAIGDNTEGFSVVVFVNSLPLALVAGFLAPIARDLLAQLTKR